MVENKIRNVIETFRRIVTADGGTLDLLAVSSGVVSVRYVPGHNEQCATCVLTPADLQLLLQEAIQRQAPDVQSVLVVDS